MKKCLIVGNCQQGPIKFLLRSVDSFNRSYTIVDLAPVHVWNMDNINNFPHQYNDADIILTQPLFDSKFGMANTSKLIEFNESAKKIPIIIFPNIDFIGFTPFTTRIPIRTDKTFAPDAQCGIVLWCYINGYDRDKAINFCREFHSNGSHAILYKTIFDIALKRLENVETLLHMDANVSFLFRNKYMDEKLMLNRWHPSNVVYTFIANRLLSSLGIYDKVITPKREFTVTDEMPISNAIKNALGINFDDGECFYYLGYLFSLSEYVTTLYSFYGENGPTVEAAVKMNEEKLKTIGSIIAFNYNDLDITALFRW
ncbi:MAG: WcbI family polysaccharide biosynthesis putative acetyltransferase [Syntrophobacteraceae bacterium]